MQVSTKHDVSTAGHLTLMLCVYCLHFVEKEVWTKVSSSGLLVPPARAGAALDAVGSKLYLFGGFNQDDAWLQDLYIFDTGARGVIHVQIA